MMARPSMNNPRYSRPCPLITALLLLICFFGPVNALAIEKARGDIPEALQQWIPWVLHDQEERTCLRKERGVGLQKRYAGTFGRP